MSNDAEKEKRLKEQRLADALRANLRRRKQAVRKSKTASALPSVDKSHPQV